MADPELTAAELGAEDTADTDPVGRWFCDELPRLLATGRAQVPRLRVCRVRLQKEVDRLTCNFLALVTLYE